MSPITRRSLLKSAGIGAAGIGIGASGYLVGQESAAQLGGEGTGSVPFYGEHQAGIDTPAQDRLFFASFDLLSESPADLRELMREWSRAAAEMSAGEMIGDVNDLEPAPPDDTGETVGHLASNLTITFGFGPGLFEKRGLGLGAKRPAALREIPPLPADELNELESGGDICVQACSDDPQVAFHAIRNLARIGRGTVAMRWSQLGFGRTASTTRAQDTPRNLMGFKDGTVNIKAEDTEAMNRFVWVGDGGPSWMRGGSYMVTRRIRMLLEIWDRSPLEDQEQTIGRAKYSGAPLGGQGRVRAAAARREAEQRPADDPGRRPRPPRLGPGQRRRADPAARLFLHRRRRREPRRARSRPLLHRLPARPGAAVRRDPAPARLQRCAQRVHQARRQRRLRRPSRSAPGRLRRRNAARLSSYSDSVRRFFVGCPKKGYLTFLSSRKKELLPDESFSRPRPVDRPRGRSAGRLCRRLRLQR
jgi:deferrochelatase/peroxidase EfeB